LRFTTHRAEDKAAAAGCFRSGAIGLAESITEAKENLDGRLAVDLCLEKRGLAGFGGVPEWLKGTESYPLHHPHDGGSAGVAQW
jgi:hypothetical protein